MVSAWPEPPSGRPAERLAERTAGATQVPSPSAAAAADGTRAHCPRNPRGSWPMSVTLEERSKIGFEKT